VFPVGAKSDEFDGFSVDGVLGGECVDGDAEVEGMSDGVDLCFVEFGSAVIGALAHFALSGVFERSAAEMFGVAAGSVVAGVVDDVVCGDGSEGGFPGVSVRGHEPSGGEELSGVVWFSEREFPVPALVRLSLVDVTPEAFFEFVVVPAVEVWFEFDHGHLL
jgi:hypothetical protein